MGPQGSPLRRASPWWYACWIVAAVFDAVGLASMWFAVMPPYWSVSAMLTAACLQAGGLLMWRRWPDNRVGALIFGASLPGMAQYLVHLPHGAALAVGYLVPPLVGVFVGHALLLYPDGRFHHRGERIFVITAYVLTPTVRVPSLLVSRTEWLSGCEARDACIANPFLVRVDSPLAYRLDNASALVVAALTLAFAGLFAYRFWRGGPWLRRAAGPLIPIAGVLVVTFILIQRTTWTLPFDELRSVMIYAQLAASVALPVAMAYGLLRIRPEAAGLLTREEAQASRALAALEERRRLERDLHDGAQQRLIGVGMSIDHARRYVDDNPTVARALDEAAAELRNSVAELRELTRGLRPVLLAERGLAGAVPVLAAHAPVPVHCHLAISERLPDDIEAAAYFVISEALQNVAKHSRAGQARVTVTVNEDRLHIEIFDDGVGGADPRAGSGLRGLADRVEAFGGVLSVSSPPGQGTTVTAEIPVPGRL